MVDAFLMFLACLVVITLACLVVILGRVIDAVMRCVRGE